MKNFFYKLIGHTQFELEVFNATYVSSKILEEFRSGIFNVIVSENNKSFTFSCYSFLNKKIKNCQYLKDANTINIKHFGLTEIIKKNRNRICILIGIIAFIIVLQVHKLFVWDIVISGNNTICEEEIIETLDKAGFSKGTLIKPEKISNVCNKCVILNKNIVWISINMSGTVAFVEVSERVEKVETKKTSLSGLISSSDGVVELVKVISGTSLVKNGDSVIKGQMLISPVATGKDENEYLVGANGEIIAKTYEKFSVIINLRRNSEQSENNSNYKYYWDFLGKEAKLKLLLFDKKNHYYIDNEKGRIKLFNKIILPISFWKKTLTDYVITEGLLNYEQAKSEAFKKIYELISSEMSNSEILSTSFTEETTDNCYILNCEVECLKNIVTE